MNPKTSPSAERQLTPKEAVLAENQFPRPDAYRETTPNAVPRPVVVDPLLFVHATAHNDLEQQRIASQHRLRILTATEPDEDGVMRGFGLSENHPDVARLAGICDALVTLEHQAELNLRRSLRGCAIHPWIKAQVGLGDKQVSRLLGAIGDPYWHATEDRPRTVSELWAYSGLHVLPVDQKAFDTHGTHVDRATLPVSHACLDTHVRPAGGMQAGDPGLVEVDAPRQNAGVAARRRKGVRSNWSTDAKTRAYLCAVSCIKKADSPYREVYLKRREHTATTHPEWTAGHSHNDALRIASKAILRDLWRESRRLHGVVDELQDTA